MTSTMTQGTYGRHQPFNIIIIIIRIGISRFQRRAETTESLQLPLRPPSSSLWRRLPAKRCRPNFQLPTRTASTATQSTERQSRRHRRRALCVKLSLRRSAESPELSVWTGNRRENTPPTQRKSRKPHPVCRRMRRRRLQRQIVVSSWRTPNGRTSVCLPLQSRLSRWPPCRRRLAEEANHTNPSMASSEGSINLLRSGSEGKAKITMQQRRT